ncbi:MAG: biopolymer transporter ExbD [Pseudomonadota bacterium]
MLFGNLKGRASPDAEVNLTPVMNLFVAMIPFLLMCTAFYQISIINASVPTISDEAPVGPDQSEKVMNVILQMDDQGYHIMGNGDNVTAAEVASVRNNIPKRGGSFDTKGLTQALTMVKNRFPRGKTVILVPDNEIPYEEIVTTMDATRWLPDTQVLPTGAAERKTLYPEVVLSSLVKENG